jgi:hypothetical protein
MGPVDYLKLYASIMSKEDLWSDYQASLNMYRKEILASVRPSEYKCLGTGRLAEMKGRCPMLPHCVYGKRYLAGTHEVLFEDLLNVT